MAFSIRNAGVEGSNPFSSTNLTIPYRPLYLPLYLYLGSYPTDTIDIDPNQAYIRIGSDESSWSVTREENAMNININMKRKFSINGKEYNSVEEMPDDIREIFKKTMGSQTDIGHTVSRAAVRTKIVLNGTEYDSVDAIPQDVRRLYENVLKGAEDGVIPHGIDVAGIYNGMMMGSKTPETARTGELRRPAKIESSFSPRALIAGILAAALILLLYYLVQNR